MLTLIEVKNKNKKIYPFGIPKSTNNVNSERVSKRKVRFANTNPIDDNKPYTRVLKK